LKINAEKEISSLISRFEKMCGDQQAHLSHKEVHVGLMQFVESGHFHLV